MRHHMTADGPIPFTPEEEAARDIEEAAWLAQRDVAESNRAVSQAIDAIEQITGYTRRQREFILAVSTDHGLKQALETDDEKIAALRVKWVTAK